MSNSVFPIFIHDPSSEQTPETPLFPSLTPYGSTVLREGIIPDPTCSFPARLAHSLLPAAVSLQTYPIATGLDPAVTPTPAPDDFRSRSVKNTGWRTAGLYLFCVRGGETSGVRGAVCWRSVSTCARLRGSCPNLRVIFSDGMAAVRGAF